MVASVHIGLDGWLFLEGGSNDPILPLREPIALMLERVQEWRRVLEHRREEFTTRGIEYIHFIVPNKVTVYPEKVRQALPNLRGGALRMLLHTINTSKDKDYFNFIIDPLSYFESQKALWDLYWKTDSHWSFFGCYSGYQLICSKLGIQPLAELIQRPYTSGMTIMDLGGKLDPPLKENVRFYNIIEKAERVHRNELVAFKEDNKRVNDIALHVGSNVVYSNNHAAVRKKVVLFGDSFSEYRPHLLMGLLAETFEEVHFVWTTSLDYGYIDRHQPDIVITEIVERFMTRLPNDNFRLEQFCKERLEAVKAL